MSTASQLYLHQIAVEDRFQEYIPLETYAHNNETEEPLLDLREIKTVKVNIIAPEKDDVCLPKHA